MAAGKAVNFLQKLNQRINSKNVLFFDMDGTLIDTNFANYLSYKKAVESVIHPVPNISYNPDIRFNRKTLKSMIPNLSETEYERIIIEKEQYYKDFLLETKLNKLIADILLKYSKTNKCVLITNCRKDRALMILDYFGLTDKFSNIYFKQINNSETKVNKYKNAIASLGVPPDLIIVFENEKDEIADAIEAGIPDRNILRL